MFLLASAGVIAGLVLVASFLTWLVLRLLGKCQGRRIFKVGLSAYCVLLPSFLFVILPLLAAWMITEAGTRPQDRQLEIDPSQFGCEFEEVQFNSRDGVELSGWWMRGDRTKPTVIFAHGLFRDRKEVVERICLLNRRGYSGLVFDLRRHGSSGGESVSLGYMERLDVLGAYDLARDRGSEKIVIGGTSMGATAALHAIPGLQARADVVALVADSPFVTLKEIVDRYVGLFLKLPTFPFSNLFCRTFAHLNGFSTQSLDSTKMVSNQTIPILLIYGVEDRRMPAETAQAIFGAINATRRKLVFFEGARHGDAFESDPDRYLREILGFVEDKAGGA